MNFIRNLFAPKKPAIKSYEDFWKWFRLHEKKFFKVVSNRGNIEKHFFHKMSPRLNELKEGVYYLTGMLNDHTAELVFTADGIIENFAFIEDLVNSAPAVDGWKFTAHKPAQDIKDVTIQMDRYTFGADNLWFFPNLHEHMPDEIDITVVHKDFNDNNKRAIVNGTFIFLDNFLGELNFATTVDKIDVAGREGAKGELIPIAKLKDYLNWRQKEFIEKYEGTRHNT
ncbi:MAG TPA: DUF695 domain-containing protein, partial [Chryseosolibacter sp.]|nr:DUF695 domain-containing protein [Chryseosolibacter sp.]